MKACSTYLVLLCLQAGAAAGKTASTTSAALSPVASIYGKPVTITATVAPAAATGNVTFYDGTQVLGSSALVSGVAVLTTTGIGSGARQIAARYVGDVNYFASISTAVAETVTTRPGGAFTFHAAYSAGLVAGLAAADLNGDGFADIVAATAGNPSLLVLLNRGDGTFQAPAGYLAGLTTKGISLADINGDGKTDILATTGSGVSFLAGKGDGSFFAPVSVLVSTDVSLIRVADLNSDGFADLIVTHTSTPLVEVRLGNGDGTFQATAPAALTLTAAISDLVTGDFNRDGIPDVAIGSTAGQTVSIFIGAGDGSFSAGATYGCDARALAAADLNGDGFTDLATGGAASLSILLGKGDGSFRLPAVTTVIFGFGQVAVADLDADGIPDLVGGGAPFSFFGNGDGTFRQGNGITSPADVVTLADFNGDGIPDIATSASSVQGIGIVVSYGKLAPVIRLTASPTPQTRGRT